jgi:hypothetical protein
MSLIAICSFSGLAHDGHRCVTCVLCVVVLVCATRILPAKWLHVCVCVCVFYRGLGCWCESSGVRGVGVRAVVLGVLVWLLLRGVSRTFNIWLNMRSLVWTNLSAVLRAELCWVSCAECSDYIYIWKHSSVLNGRPTHRNARPWTHERGTTTRSHTKTHISNQQAGM